MRRVALALAATLIGLILILGYKSSPGTTRPVSLAPGVASLNGSSGGSPSGSSVPPSAGSSVPPSGGSTGSSSASPPRTSPPRTSAPGTSGRSAPPPPSPRGGPQTVDGTAVGYEFGTMQVQATISGGKLDSVTVIQQPQDGHSMRINTYALPVLEQEAVTAQGAQIDTVSGATLTSDAFAQSLQGALQKVA